MYSTWPSDSGILLLAFNLSVAAAAAATAGAKGNSAPNTLSSSVGTAANAQLWTLSSSVGTAPSAHLSHGPQQCWNSHQRSA